MGKLHGTTPDNRQPTLQTSMGVGVGGATSKKVDRKGREVRMVLRTRKGQALFIRNMILPEESQKYLMRFLLLTKNSNPIRSGLSMAS